MKPLFVTLPVRKDKAGNGDGNGGAKKQVG